MANIDWSKLTFSYTKTNTILKSEFKDGAWTPIASLTEDYLHFSLTMARSPGFGSMATDFMRALNTRFRCASDTKYLKLARYHNSPDRSTKSTTPPFNGLCLLVSTRFQVLFHSPPGVLFTFPSRYCSSIGH